MIRIGDFARLSQVSIVTLRHYDELGLIEPISVDPVTGYRYYSVGQLPRLNRIMSLKDLGFSLGQIRDVLDDGVSLEQLQDMLRLKRVEVGCRLTNERERLARIEARLRQIEQENTMPDYEVVLKTVAPMLVASRRITIPTNDQVPDYLNPAFEEVFSYVSEQGLKPSSSHLALWHTTADTYTDEDVEALVPVARTLPGTERVNVYELPQIQVASVVHHGDFSDFTQTHVALHKWVEDNSYRVTGPYREIYLEHDPDDLSNSTTEVQYPVEKA